MKKNNYVLKHNFNYGRGKDKRDVNVKKLVLRNEIDLQDYLKQLAEDTFVDIDIIKDENEIKVGEAIIKIDKL